MMAAGRFVEVNDRAIVSLIGPESLDLLQRISTNDVTNLKADGAVQTVLTTEKGRIVDVVSVLRYGDQGLLVVGHAEDSLIMKQWIERFIIMEDITVEILSDKFHSLIAYDVSEKTEVAMRSTLPSSSRIFEERLASVSLYHVIAPKELSEETTKGMSEVGLMQGDLDDFEAYRVVHGIPGFPAELSTSYNPLEAGLLDLVSFTKGCYVGQEVVARLDTYKKVQRELLKIQMAELPAHLPEKIYFHGQEWGSITSAVRLKDSHECRGLGYIRTGSETRPAELYFHNGEKRIELSMISRHTKAT